MRVPWLLMAAGVIGILVAATVSYGSPGNDENAPGFGLLLLILCATIFFAGWVMAVAELRRRSKRKREDPG